jgi:DNA-binding NtrC family response regulator
MQHILVVDDEMQIGTLFKRFLELKGYRVSMASNGESALQISQRDQIEAVIPDFSMLRMKEDELLSELRKSHPGLPAIIVPGYLGERDLNDCQTAVFNKPVNLSMLEKSSKC